MKLTTRRIAGVTVLSTAMLGVGGHYAADWRIESVAGGAVCGIARDFAPTWEATVLRRDLADKADACTALLDRPISECPLLAQSSAEDCGALTKRHVGRALIVSHTTRNERLDVGILSSLKAMLRSSAAALRGWLSQGWLAMESLRCDPAPAYVYDIYVTGSPYKQCLGTGIDGNIVTAAHCMPPPSGAGVRTVSLQCGGSFVESTCKVADSRCSPWESSCKGDIAVCSEPVQCAASPSADAAWARPRQLPGNPTVVEYRNLLTQICLLEAKAEVKDWPDSIDPNFVKFELAAPELVEDGDSGGGMFDDSKPPRLVAVTSFGSHETGSSVPLYQWANQVAPGP